MVEKCRDLHFVRLIMSKTPGWVAQDEGRPL
jgi:hypothetical protein